MEKIHLFFQRFWTGLMVFKPLLVKGLTLWNYKWTCTSIRWSQESPRLKKMCLTFVQALIFHHRRHHHLRFLYYQYFDFKPCILAILLWYLNNLLFPYLHGMFEQILSMLFDYVDFIVNLFMIIASWFLLHDLVDSFFHECCMNVQLYLNTSNQICTLAFC